MQSDVPANPLAQEKWPGQTPAKVIFAGVCALILTIGIARFSYTPLLPLMRGQTGLGSIGAGWLATINYLGYLGGAVIAASIHRLDAKFLLYRIGLVLAVASTFAMGLTSDFRLWLLLRFVSGWSSTAGMLIASGLVLNWLTRHGRRPELGIHFAGFGIGIVVSGLTVLWTTDHLSYGGQWRVLGVLALVFLLPAWAWMPAPAATHRHHHDAPDDAPTPRWMLLFSLAYFCGGFGYVITATFIVDIVRNMPAISLPGPWVWVLMGAIAVPSCFLWDRVSARIGQLPALTLAYGLQTASFALTALGTGLPAITLAAVLFGLTVIGTVSLTLSIIGRRFPANPARAMARLTLSYGAAQMIGPLVAGYVGHANGDFHGALLMATAIGGTGTLISAGLSLAGARRP